MYKGPPVDDFEILDDLPSALVSLLSGCNGYVAYWGGLHLRGACLEPEWHSLRAAWHGPAAIHRLFPAVGPEDVPFAQDCLGDQYVLREGRVHRLSAESGQLVDLGLPLTQFDAESRADPVGFLSLQPLLAYRERGGKLAPGELLAIYPPLVINTDAEYCYKALPASARLQWLSSLAADISTLPDGAEVTVSRPW